MLCINTLFLILSEFIVFNCNCALAPHMKYHANKAYWIETELRVLVQAELAEAGVTDQSLKSILKQIILSIRLSHQIDFYK